MGAKKNTDKQNQVVDGSTALPPEELLENQTAGQGLELIDESVVDESDKDAIVGTGGGVASSSTTHIVTVPASQYDPEAGVQRDLSDDKSTKRNDISETMITEAVLKFMESFGIQSILAEMQGLRDELKFHTAVRDGGITCAMVGVQVNCPECGLRLISPSLTAVQGAKGACYEHPFHESTQLGGKQCRLKGQKFKSPVIYLEALNPDALKPAKLEEALTGVTQ